jgi:hypothetical protein
VNPLQRGVVIAASAVLAVGGLWGALRAFQYETPAVGYALFGGAAAVAAFMVIWRVSQGADRPPGKGE